MNDRLGAHVFCSALLQRKLCTRSALCLVRCRDKCPRPTWGGLLYAGHQQTHWKRWQKCASRCTPPPCPTTICTLFASCACACAATCWPLHSTSVWRHACMTEAPQQRVCCNVILESMGDGLGTTFDVLCSAPCTSLTTCNPHGLLTTYCRRPLLLTVPAEDLYR